MNTVEELELSVLPLIAVIIVAIFYVILVIYLIVHMLGSIFIETFGQKDVIQKYFFNEAHNLALKL